MNSNSWRTAFIVAAIALAVGTAAFFLLQKRELEPMVSVPAPVAAAPVQVAADEVAEAPAPAPEPAPQPEPVRETEPAAVSVQPEAPRLPSITGRVWPAW
jgi:hypothetical protein